MPLEQLEVGVGLGVKQFYLYSFSIVLLLDDTI